MSGENRCPKCGCLFGEGGQAWHDYRFHGGPYPPPVRRKPLKNDVEAYLGERRRRILEREIRRRKQKPKRKRTSW